MRLRRRIQVLFLALFLVVVVGVGIDALVESERDEAIAVVDETLDPARDELTNLLTALVDQESGQRGYLITGSETFLDPYVEGQRDASDALSRVTAILARDREARAGIDRIRSRITAWQQLAADFEINVKRSGRDDVVRALVASGTGMRLFERIRTEIADVNAIVERRLARQEHHVDGLGDLLTAVRITDVVVSVVLLLLVGRLVRRWVTAPLTDLTDAVRGAASGRLHDPIATTGPPDLTELANDIDAMRRRLLAEVDDADRARTALADRGMIVVALRDDLAPTEVELPPTLTVAGRFRPAKGLVAGDWYDVVRLDADRIAVALVDVAGHGAEVATFALRTKSLAMAAIASNDPGQALEWLAAHLGPTGELFLTGAIVEVSASTGAVRYASAGHPPLLLAGVTGITELPATGPLLGPFAGTWATGTARLERGGVLVAYSDGLTEARNAHGELFGVERLRTVVAEHQLTGADGVADAVLTQVELFATELGADDVTLCVVGR